MSKDNKELNAIEAFVIKCVEKIKASDDNKIKLAANQIVKTYNKEIAARERKIADIKTQEKETLIDFEEQIAELEEEKRDTARTMDIELIGTNTDRKNYVEIYTSKLSYAISNLKAKEKQIEEYKSDVAKNIETLEKEIQQFKDLLSEMR